MPGTLKGWIDRCFLPGFPSRDPSRLSPRERKAASAPTRSVATSLSLAPGVAFRLPATDGSDDTAASATGLIPDLTNVKKLGLFTTFGSKWHMVTAVGDSGRNLLARARLPLFSPDCSVLWRGLHDMDNANAAQRTDFLNSVQKAYTSF